MQKEITVNDNGTVTVSVSLKPSIASVTEIRVHNVINWLKEEGVKHGQPMPNQPVVSSDLGSKGVSLSGDFVFEAPQEYTPALAAALGVDPSMSGVVISTPTPKKTRTKKSTKTSARKTSTRKTTAKKTAKSAPGVETSETSAVELSSTESTEG